MVQLQAINYILSSKDASFFVLNNLTEDYFCDYRDEFKYIKQHYDTYHNVPDIESFLNIFTKFTVLEVNESPKYLLDELFKDRQTRQIVECVNKMREPLMKGDVNTASQIFMSGVESVQQSVHMESVDIFKDAWDRYDSYVDRVEDYKKYYVTTGFPELDEVIGGWDRKEELATIMARPGTGKCLKKGTVVLTKNGKKKIENIKIGDIVKTLHGLNVVTGTHSGISAGYKVSSLSGKTSFTVTDGHILTVYDVKENKLIDATIEAVKKRHEKEKDNWRLVRKGEKAHILYQFTIERVEEPFEYYGFECDGDHRFLLEDGTLTHNSWIALKCAVAAARAGLKVGLYSGEMSENKVGYRIDSLVSGISNFKISKGKEDVMQDYKSFIDKITKDDFCKGSIKVITPARINGPAGVSALRAFIEKEHLDMLCIDQHSLLEDDRHGKSPVERASNISRDLKNLQVMTKIPIIAVSQQNRVKPDDGSEVDVANIAQSDRIGQDSTAVIAIDQKDGILTLSLVKSRDSVVGKRLKYAVNFDTGLFEFQPEGDDATGGSHTEALKNEYVNDNETEAF